MFTELLPVFIVLRQKSFLMGTPEQELGELARNYGGLRESYLEEAPQHEVQLPAFAIAKLPVTNALYAAYTAATGARPPITWHAAMPPEQLYNHPVVDVSWQEAGLFCSWLTRNMTEAFAWQLCDDEGRQVNDITGYEVRLPGEAEWEYAARGRDGRRFPWGNRFDSGCANTRESAVAMTSPAGAYPNGASPCGALDMAGNVWEWTASLERSYPYQHSDGREAALAAGRRILRGGCYANPAGFARCACRFRLPPDMHNEFIGFRLALSLKET